MKWRKHLFVPDTQIKPGVPTDHIDAAARYASEKRPDVVIISGDWYDFPSLSTHGDADVESRYQEDVQVGNDALARFTKILLAPRGYTPRMVFLFGNHDSYAQGDKTGGRPGRFLMQNPKMRGKISRNDLNIKELGWEAHEFLHPVLIDGILYAHYFYAPLTGNCYGGSAVYKLSKIHHSFTMGHVQGLDVGRVELPGGRRLRGVVAGSFYQHEEKYKGPQANNHWRGIIVKHEVHDGDFDLMEVSIDYLLRKWA